MFISPLKTLFVESLHTVFDEQYPKAEFRGTHCSLEFPVESSAYPEIWLTYSDTDRLRRAGVRHRESLDPVTGLEVAPFTRWVFQGTMSFTVVALSSLERDRLFDELLSVIAFSGEDPLLGRFRQAIETNDLIAVTAQWDEVESVGEDAAPGTQWSTDEVVYERSLNLDLRGEFVPDPVAGTLVPLSKIEVTATADPTGTVGGFDAWH